MGLLLLISSPAFRKWMGRGGYSLQHWHKVQAVYDPGYQHVFEQKQQQLEEHDDDGDRPPDPA